MSYRKNISSLLIAILMVTGIVVIGSAADQPVADFGVQNSFNQGFAPFTAQFEDHSTLAASWMWDFSDGQTSTGQNPVHTFTNPGTYTVSLTVYDATGTMSNTKTVPGCIIVAADPMSGGIVTTETTVTPTNSITITTTTTTTNVTATPALNGNIAITSQPSGAMVSLDSVQQGITPITLYRISAGRHAVLVHLKGFPDNETVVTVKHEQTVLHDVDLTRIKTTPVVSAASTSSPVTKITTTPAAESQKAAANFPTIVPTSTYIPGTGRIHIRCTGCMVLPYSDPHTIRYTIEQRNDFGAWMRRNYGEVGLVTPTEVYSHYVTPGEYVVRVKPDHYVEQEQNIAVIRGQTTDVDFRGDTFVRAPGFTSFLAVLAVAGIIGFRRMRR